MSEEKKTGTSLEEFDISVRFLTGGGKTGNTEPEDPTKPEEEEKSGDKEDEK